MKLKEALKEELDEEEISIVKGSYDVIGDIVILELDKKLKAKEKIIGETLLKLNKNIKTILKKKGAHEGVYRIQTYSYVAGEKKTITEHKENNCKFILDISKVYFSPRLANERLRIAKLVKKNEEVLVMFSGIGVYPVVISKNSKAKGVYGVEFNKSACEYAKRNVSLNLVSNVYLYCCDIRKFKINKKFDRILMPLPKGAEKFLDVAKKFIKKKGVIHFYTFSNEEDIDKISDTIKKTFKKFKILNVVKCGDIAPGVYRFCIDFKEK